MYIFRRASFSHFRFTSWAAVIFATGYKHPLLNGFPRFPSYRFQMGLFTSSREGAKLQAPPVILCCVEADAVSPLQDFMTKETPTWEAVMRQVGRRVSWADERNFQVDVITITPNSSSSLLSSLLSTSTILFGIGLNSAFAAETLANAVESCPTPPAVRLIWGSAAAASDLTQLGKFKPSTFSEFPTRPRLSLLRSLRSGGTAKDRRMWELAKTLCEKSLSRELAFCLLALISTYVTPVPTVQGLLKKPGLRVFGCVATKCRRQFLQCIRNPQCKAALDCLKACPPGDPVCHNRCSITYGNPTYVAFSLCAVQKNNCLISTLPPLPTLRTPKPAPASVLNGVKLTFDKSEDIMVGWLGVDGQKWSWKVVCWQNGVYEFSDQHQIFYRMQSTGRLWYDPVFRTPDSNGQSVWRRRHHMVKRGEIPGIFYGSVSDNGVTTSECWTIIDVADDMSWAVIYYTGESRAAFIQTAEATLVTKDGHMPKDLSAIPRIRQAIAACGVETWELSQVAHTVNAPDLEIAEQHRLMQKPNPLQRQASIAL